jgi:mRNA interferase RelE/StbE
VEIVIARDAGKVLARMQPAKAKDIREAIDKVAADPTAQNNNLRALNGVPSGFRIRVGDWRVSYTLDRPAGVMRVFEIAPRGGAYR